MPEVDTYSKAVPSWRTQVRSRLGRKQQLEHTAPTTASNEENWFVTERTSNDAHHDRLIAQHPEFIAETTNGIPDLPTLYSVSSQTLKSGTAEMDGNISVITNNLASSTATRFEPSAVGANSAVTGDEGGWSKLVVPAAVAARQGLIRPTLGGPPQVDTDHDKKTGWEKTGVGTDTARHNLQHASFYRPPNTGLSAVHTLTAPGWLARGLPATPATVARGTKRASEGFSFKESSVNVEKTTTASAAVLVTSSPPAPDAVASPTSPPPPPSPQLSSPSPSPPISPLRPQRDAVSVKDAVSDRHTTPTAVVARYDLFPRKSGQAIVSAASTSYKSHLFVKLLSVESSKSEREAHVASFRPLEKRIHSNFHLVNRVQVLKSDHADVNVVEPGVEARERGLSSRGSSLVELLDVSDITQTAEYTNSFDGGEQHREDSTQSTDGLSAHTSFLTTATAPLLRDQSSGTGAVWRQEDSAGETQSSAVVRHNHRALRVEARGVVKRQAGTTQRSTPAANSADRQDTTFSASSSSSSKALPNSSPLLDGLSVAAVAKGPIIDVESSGQPSAADEHVNRQSTTEKPDDDVSPTFGSSLTLQSQVSSQWQADRSESHFFDVASGTKGESNYESSDLDLLVALTSTPVAEESSPIHALAFQLVSDLNEGIDGKFPLSSVTSPLSHLPSLSIEDDVVSAAQLHPSLTSGYGEETIRLSAAGQGPRDLRPSLYSSPSLLIPTPALSPPPPSLEPTPPLVVGAESLPRFDSGLAQRAFATSTSPAAAVVTSSPSTVNRGQAVADSGRPHRWHTQTQGGLHLHPATAQASAVTATSAHARGDEGVQYEGRFQSSAVNNAADSAASLSVSRLSTRGVLEDGSDFENVTSVIQESAVVWNLSVGNLHHVFVDAITSSFVDVITSVDVSDIIIERGDSLESVLSDVLSLSWNSSAGGRGGTRSWPDHYAPADSWEEESFSPSPSLPGMQMMELESAARSLLTPYPTASVFVYSAGSVPPSADAEFKGRNVVPSISSLISTSNSTTFTLSPSTTVRLSASASSEEASLSAFQTWTTTSEPNLADDVSTLLQTSFPSSSLPVTTSLWSTKDVSSPAADASSLSSAYKDLDAGHAVFKELLPSATEVALPDTSSSGTRIISLPVPNVSVSPLSPVVVDDNVDVFVTTTVTTTTTITDNIRSSTTSDQPCSATLLPTSGSGGESSAVGDRNNDVIVTTLAVIVPVAVLILVVIIVALLCCRRKKTKKVRGNNEGDLWVNTGGSQVVPPLTLSFTDDHHPQAPAFTSTVVDNPLSPPTAPTAETNNVAQHGDLYKVVHPFPAREKTHLTLDLGDVIKVLEKASPGWWLGEKRRAGGVPQPDEGVEETSLTLSAGWFPSSFVVPLVSETSAKSAKDPDIASLEVFEPPAAGLLMSEEEAHNAKPRVSSFLIKKLPAARAVKENNSFSLGKVTSQGPANLSVGRSPSMLTPVGPVRLDTPPTTLPPVTSVNGTAAAAAKTLSLGPEDFSASVRGKHFKVLFAYKAAFRGELNLREGEIIEGKERDRNGWMLGRKASGKEEGWFPAVYVDQIENLPVTSQKSESSVTSQPLDNEVYGQLSANRTKSPDQSWVGIEHRAVGAFHAQPRDGEQLLQLTEDLLVLVVEALESGWWLGCHGDQVGWFPGDRVELLEERAETSTLPLDALRLLPPSYDPDNLLNLSHSSSAISDSNNNEGGAASKRNSLASSLDTTPGDLGQVRSPLRQSEESLLSTQTAHSEGAASASDAKPKPKPARPAPQPPALNGLSQHLKVSQHLNVSMLSVASTGSGTLSRNLRPMRPAPAPPLGGSKGRSESVASMDKVLASSRPSTPAQGVPSSSPGRTNAMLKDGGTSTGTNRAAATGRKQRKPRVVRVPKERLGLDKISSCPPPPYPTPLSVTSSPHTPARRPHIPPPAPPHLEIGRECGDAEGDLRLGPSSSASHSGRSSPALSGVGPDGVFRYEVMSSLCSSPSSSRGTSSRHSNPPDSEKESSDSDQDSDVSAYTLTSAMRGDKDLGAKEVGSATQARPKGSEKRCSTGSGMDIGISELTGSFDTHAGKHEATETVHRDQPVLHPPSSADDLREASEGLLQTRSDTVASVHERPSVKADRENVPMDIVALSERADKKSDNTDTDLQSQLSDHVKQAERAPTSQGTDNISVLSGSSNTETTVETSKPDADHRERAEDSQVECFPHRKASDATEHSDPNDSRDNGQHADSASEVRPAGYWKFHASHVNSQIPRPKAVTLTKVAPPVVPRAGKARSMAGTVEEETGVEVPESGPGRVSQIVHQINRMTSQEEQQLKNNPPPITPHTLIPQRKGSLQQPGPGAPQSQPPQQLKEGLQLVSATQLAQSRIPQVHRHSPAIFHQPKNDQATKQGLNDSKQDNVSDIVPKQSVVNSAADSHLSGTSAVDSHSSGTSAVNSHGQDKARTEQHAALGEDAVAVYVPASALPDQQGADHCEADSESDAGHHPGDKGSLVFLPSSAGHAPEQSRLPTPRSRPEGEGEGRGHTSKRQQAPPPPKSAPPSSRIPRLSVSPEGTSEC